MWYKNRSVHFLGVVKLRDMSLTFVHVLTLAGKSMVRRVAGSLLNNVNMKELITYNYTDYKNMALKISNNKSYYNTIKSRLKKEKLTSPLFNTKQYTKDLEKIYSNLHQDFKNNF